MAITGEISHTVNDLAGELGVGDSAILIQIIQKTKSILRIEKIFLPLLIHLFFLK